MRTPLRFLMIATAVLAGVLGWMTDRAQVQRNAGAAVERAGGSVRYDWQWQWIKGRPVPTGYSRA